MKNVPENIAEKQEIPSIDPARQEYEAKAAQKGIDILKTLSAAPNRADYFGNPLSFTESLTGLMRESLDRSITSEVYYGLKEESQKTDDLMPSVTEEEFKNDPNLFREGIKFHEGYNYDYHANRAKRFDERRELEEINRYSSGWQKVGRFIAGMGADLITDPIPNLIMGGLGSVFAKTITKAFLVAGSQNLVLDELIDYFKADSLIDEGERPKTFQERNIERVGTFLLGGALGATMKAGGNIWKKARANKKPPDEILNEAQLDPKSFKEVIDPFETKKLATQDASDKVTNLSKAMQQMQASESLDTKRLSSIENSNSFLKSNEALVTRAGKVSTIELPKDFKIPFSNNLLEVNYKIVDLDLLIKSNEIGGKIDELYPKALEPTNKSSPQNIDLIKSIGENLDPEELILSNNLTRGAPLINKENIVINGNNRVNGLDYAFEIQNATQYIDALQKMFPQYDVSGMTKPILVREIESELTSGELKQLKNLKEDLFNTQELQPKKVIDPESAEKEIEKALLGKEERPNLENEVSLSPENAAQEALDAVILENLSPEYRAEFKQALEFEEQLGQAYKNVINCIKT